MVVKSREVDAPHLDLGYLAFFLGLRVNQLVLEQMHAAGFDNVRESHGYVIQRLIEEERTITELARRMEVTQQAASKFVAELVVLGTALACGGPVPLVLARLALAGGRPGEAAARCETALADAEATGLVGWVGPLALALAEARHAAGDVAAAAAAAKRAIEVARRLGQAGVVDAAARLRRPLRAIEGGRRGAAGQARRPRIARADP